MKYDKVRSESHVEDGLQWNRMDRSEVDFQLKEQNAVPSFNEMGYATYILKNRQDLLIMHSLYAHRESMYYIEYDGQDGHTRVYPKVSGLAAWSENCKWYSSLPLRAVVSLFCESV
jgi:hypothetical protein